MEIETQEIFQDEIKTVVRKAIESLMEVRNIDNNESFWELGLTSVMAVELIAFINQQFNTDLEVEALFSYQTIADITEYIMDVTKK
jgi:acyl carrier protein